MEQIKNPFTFIVKTFRGLEEILAEECRKLGAIDVDTLTRAVTCKGDIGTLYKINYLSRTALRVMMPLHTFPAHNEQLLYDGVVQYEWKNIFEVSHTFAVFATVVQSTLNHTQYVSLKVKDGIVDYYKKHLGTRPNVDTQNPDFIIQVHISNDVCTLYLDATGDNLYKRGWRKAQHKAPLNEVLAAGIIQLSNWNRLSPIADFMCGSGTLLIEAAMLALNIPAGFYRQQYACFKWKEHDSQLWHTIRDNAQARIIQRPLQLYGSDIDMLAIDSALQNIDAVQLQEFITISRADFNNTTKPAPAGCVFINPPYDKRIHTDDVIALYKNIGNTLKRHYSGWQAYMLSGNIDAAKFVGLRPHRKHLLFNGPIECRLFAYDLFEGKKYSTPTTGN